MVGQCGPDEHITVSIDALSFNEPMSRSAVTKVHLPKNHLLWGDDIPAELTTPLVGFHK